MTTHDWVTVVVAVFSILVQLIVAAYVYGKLTGKVAEHGRQHASHDTRFKEIGEEQNRQWESIGRHGERISSVEARVTAVEVRRASH